MANLEQTLKDLEIATHTDKELQKTTQYFKNRNVLTNMLIDSLSYSSLEDLFEICIKFPELKEKILEKKRETDRSTEENRRMWASVDMSNPSNW